MTRAPGAAYNESGFAGPSQAGALVYVMASSTIIDIGGLLVGGRQTLRIDQPVKLEPFEGWSFPDPARVELEVRGRERNLQVVGTIDVTAHGACDRCLVETDQPMHVDVDEELEPKAALKDDPFGENNVLEGDRLDIADLAKQLVLSAAPFAVLCKPGCLGLCANCGQNKNEGACDCAPDLE